MALQSQMMVRAVAPEARIAWWRPRRPAKASAEAVALDEKPRKSIAFYALVGFTFVLLLAPQEHYSFLNPLHLAVVTSVVAALTLIYERTRRHQKILASGSSVAIAVGLVVWTLFTIPFSMWPGGSLDLFTSVYFKSIVIFLLLGAVVDSSVKLRHFAWALTLFAIPLAFTALLNFADHNIINEAQGGVQALDRIVGYQAPLSQNPNDLALILNLILPLSCALFISTKTTGKRILLAAVIALDAGAVVATFSRAGFLTLAVVFLGFTWKLRKRPERIFIAAAWGLGLVCLLLLPAGYLGHLGTITNIAADATGSAQERSRDMLVAAGQILERPIVGVGLGMNMLALNAARGATWRSVHNVYLQYAVDLGLPGILLFLLLFKSCWSGLKAALKKIRGDESRAELFNLGEGLQLSLLGFALAAFFHPAGYNFFFFFFAGLAVAARGIALGSK